MDVKKHVEQPSETPTLGLLQASTESLDASIRRAQEALSAVSARVARQMPASSQTTDRFVETDAMPLVDARAVAERCIAGEVSDAARMARAFSALLTQVDALEADHAGRRRVLRQWMVSQLTYKMLYLHHTGQDPKLPGRALRAQKEQVRAQVSALQAAGRSYADVRLADLRFAEDGKAGGAA
jgi:hypothetical protein